MCRLVTTRKRSTKREDTRKRAKKIQQTKKYVEKEKKRKKKKKKKKHGKLTWPFSIMDDRFQLISVNALQHWPLHR